MEPIHDPKVLARVRLMFDLYEAAEVIMRQNLHRWFPQENDGQIERRLLAWLRKDPNYARQPFEATAGTTH